MGCFQIATWAESADELEKIMRDRRRTNVIDHSYISGSLGEAVVTVVRSKDNYLA